MAKALLATLAALMLIGVLSLLIVESRAVNEEYYVAHAERVRAIETTRGEIAAIIQGARGAFREGRSVPASTDLAFARLSDSNATLQSLYDSAAAETALKRNLAAYGASLGRFIVNGRSFLDQQNQLADTLRDLQDESPAAVKDLRRFDLRIQSQNAFSLAIDVIEFASGQSDTTAAALAARINAMRDDPTIDARAPGRLDVFLDAANSVVNRHTAAETSLAKITGSTIATPLRALEEALLQENRRVVDRVERAGLLLAVCAAILLGGVGYVVWRLQTSYRTLNQSNAELGKVNTTLEDRVAIRTEELTGAYDELKESQVQLVHAEKMSSLGELVAGISHEINTPLWYLTNNATVVQERLDSILKFCSVVETMVDAVRTRDRVKEAISRGIVQLDAQLKDGMTDDIDEARDLIQDSIDGLEELTELAQSLKDFSRLDRAKQGEFSVNDGLDKTLLIAKNKLKNKVTVHKQYGEVPMLRCSPSQINQVFLNLITNAADAIETSGEIAIRTWNDGGNICVSITDTGCGILDDVLPSIRNPFFTTKEVGKGTGLGLSIVDRIVTAHDGEMQIDSVVDKGTVVTLSLPLVAPEQADDIDKDTAAGLRQSEDATTAANEDLPVLTNTNDDLVAVS